jgi:hypothetical protein
MLSFANTQFNMNPNFPTLFNIPGVICWKVAVVIAFESSFCVMSGVSGSGTVGLLPLHHL